MRFDAQLRFAGGNRGANTDVQGHMINSAVPFGDGGVNAMGWQDEARDIQIGRGKTELAAELVPGDDFSTNSIRPPQHLGSVIQVSRTYRFANPGAAHGLAIERNGAQAVDLEM